MQDRQRSRREPSDVDGQAREGSRAGKRANQSRGFTLIELLVVIAIIVILLGLAFPAFQGVQNQAKKTQAKNDITQIVTAVNAYYTEYGKYPLLDQGADKTLPGDYTQDNLMNVLRAKGSGWDDPAGANLNPRRIVFFSPPDAKDATQPKSGIGANDNKLYDPWAAEYRITIDGNYDNVVAHPSTGPDVRQGVIAWSLGKKSSDPTDDVISWQ